MDFGKLVSRVQKTLLDNSPAILTAIGVSGVLATAYLAGRASYRFGKEVAYIESDNQEYMTPTQKKSFFLEKKLWKLYIPAAGSAVATVAAILCATKIGSKRTAALASAYTLAQQGFDAYRDKIFEKIGESKEREIFDEVAQENVSKNPPAQIIMSGPDVLFRDGFSGRDFRSTMEKIRRAQNETNHQVNNDFAATLTDFYERIGLEPTDSSDEFGWHSDKLLDIRFSATIAGDQPCMYFTYDVAPIRGFHRMS